MGAIEARLPCWVLTYWYEVIAIRANYLEPWARAEENLEKRNQSWKDKDKDETQTLIAKIYHAFSCISWCGNIRGFSIEEPIVELSKYASNQWLSDVHENQMLELLRRKVRLQPGGQEIKIENTYFYGFLENGYKCRESGEYEDSRYFARARGIGHELAAGLGSQVGFLVNTNHNHWVAVVLDFKSHIILIGDSLNPEPYRELRTVLQWWTSHHSGHQFTEHTLNITRQQDLVSCGLLSFNALAHHFLPTTYSLTSASQVQNGRLQVLLNVVNQHLDQVRLRHLI
ncbi:uncharacterized protein EDB91DRAFT_1055161 [Suillus paluster]|uniref:uncharacterized protein n=1 Tax=Suillus paluster TaxID=48578 RepID=UPI001B87648F|nr:uncharacterized protein EDB91DRAFT_1055161 [Suillus paluster]KAG1737088.1 hypothetical protein EDB91DRAFT_1055161 [Suillus paluster]